MQINEELIMGSGNSDQSINILNPQIVKILADVSYIIAVVQNIMILSFVQRYYCSFKYSDVTATG